MHHPLFAFSSLWFQTNSPTALRRSQIIPSRPAYFHIYLKQTPEFEDPQQTAQIKRQTIYQSFTPRPGCAHLTKKMTQRSPIQRTETNRLLKYSLTAQVERSRTHLSGSKSEAPRMNIAHLPLPALDPLHPHENSVHPNHTQDRSHRDDPRVTKGKESVLFGGALPMHEGHCAVRHVGPQLAVHVKSSPCLAKCRYVCCLDQSPECLPLAYRRDPEVDSFRACCVDKLRQQVEPNWKPNLVACCNWKTCLWTQNSAETGLLKSSTAGLQDVSPPLSRGNGVMASLFDFSTPGSCGPEATTGKGNHRTSKKPVIAPPSSPLFHQGHHTLCLIASYLPPSNHS